MGFLGPPRLFLPSAEALDLKPPGAPGTHRYRETVRVDVFPRPPPCRCMVLCAVTPGPVLRPSSLTFTIPRESFCPTLPDNPRAEPSAFLSIDPEPAKHQASEEPLLAEKKQDRMILEGGERTRRLVRNLSFFTIPSQTVEFAGRSDIRIVREQILHCIKPPR